MLGLAPSPEDQEEIDRRHFLLRQALLKKLRAAGIDWRLETEYDAERVVAGIRRGELLIRGHVTRDPPWWRMPEREVVEDLAYVLIGTHAKYADADEEGYRVGMVEIDGHLEAIRMSPGVRQSNGEGQDPRLFFRLGDYRGLPLEKAISEGWVRIL